MREYKFRGKRIDNGKWAYGHLFYGKNEEGQTEAFIVSENYNCHGGIIDLDTCASWKVDINTVGQYTGLRDKNRKEIYDGDILKYAGGGIYTVVFNEMMIMCPHDNIKMPSPGYYGILVRDKTKELCPLGVTQRLAKVIGNIYDNLEGAK